MHLKVFSKHSVKLRVNIIDPEMTDEETTALAECIEKNLVVHSKYNQKYCEMQQKVIYQLIVSKLFNL